MHDKPLSALLGEVESDASWQRLLEHVQANTPTDISAPRALRPLVISALARQRLVLAVTATSREAEDLRAELESFIDASSVAEFVSWETLPHERLSPSADVVGRRLATLRRLRHADEDHQNRIQVVVAPIRALLQPLVAGIADLTPVALHKGHAVEFDQAIADLAAAGYARVDLVEKRGQFAVRGGLIDVFPPAEEHPMRVEFWGDSVDEVRSFSVADQRSLGEVPEGLWAPPCRELLITDAVRIKARALIETYPNLSEILEKISEGIYVDGIEALEIGRAHV